MNIQQIRLALLSLIPFTAFGQPQPDLASILEKISKTYTSVSQYELIAEPGASAGSEATRMLIAFQGPNRYRMDGTIPGLGSQKILFVHDGSNVWCYTSEQNVYFSYPAEALTAGAEGDLGDLNPKAIDEFMMWRYRAAKAFVDSAKFLRREKIEFGGNKVNCYVLSVSPKRVRLTYTWWVDARRFLVLREDNANSSVRYTAIKLGQRLSDDLFQFKPPPGARKVDPQ